jgi:hypothetical protein
VKTTIVDESITGRKWKNGKKKAAGLERKPAALEVISCTSKRLFFALISRLGCKTQQTIRSRDPGEKRHPYGDVVTIHLLRFRGISTAAFFVTFCIKCHWEISETVAQPPKARCSSLFISH